MLNKNKLIVIIFVLVFFLTFSIVLFLNKGDYYVIERKNINLVLSQENSENEWFKEQHEEQWITNSKFDDDEDEGWSKEISGDASDLDANINDEQANFIVSGESHSFTPLSGIIDNSTGENYYRWHNASNPDVPALPTNGYQYISDNGFYVSHEWEDNGAVPPNLVAYQRASVQWEKIIRTPQDMSDYRIISASFEMLINATVNAAYRRYADAPSGGKGGIEVYGDEGTTNGYIFSGDYIRYYARVSDIYRNYTREFLDYTPIGLGKDSAGRWDRLNDTEISPEFNEDFIQYLNEVFNFDSREFVIILGIEFFCEDNAPDGDDWDFFNSTYIKACNFSFSYEKLINKESTVSWEYEGNQIDNKGGNIEILDSKLYFDYKVNSFLVSLSPSSEINIIICDKLFPSSLSISRGSSNFKEANKKGFDVADLIDDDDNITVEIQLLINTDFSLSNGKYYISIDDVILEINYEIYLSFQQSLLLQILIILAIVGLLCFAFYIIYYQKVLKYPKPIRKLRKFRRTLHKHKEPKIDTLNRSNSLMEVYRSKTQFYDSAIQETQLKTKMGMISRKKKIFKKKPFKIQGKTYSMFLLVIVFLGFLAIPLSSNYSASKSSEPNSTLFISQFSGGSFQLIREPHEKQWIKNSEFENYEDWIIKKSGDLSDFNAEISSGEAQIKVLGDRQIILFNESDPRNNNWILLENEYNFTNTDVKQITQYGWNISHLWEDGSVNSQHQLVISKWQKNFSLNNLGFEPSDYRIVSASLQAYINASVNVSPAGKTTPGGGFDQVGDTQPGGESGVAIGDNINYFISLSDWERNRILSAVSYQTLNLGKDDPSTPTLNDTKILPSSEETLIYYLNQILESNEYNFSMIVGFKVWCEDNSENDRDVLNYANLKNLTLSLTLEKKINKDSSLSWIYQGGKINAEKKKVEITDTKLNFDYRINSEGYSNIISNSEIRIYINEEEHLERVSLKNAKSSMEEVKEGGFDVSSIIPEDEEINLEIRIALTDDAILEDNFEIIFDNVELEISYDLITEIEQIILWPILIGIISLISCLIGYYIYYQRVLKYPKPIRKLRKFRKTLDKTTAPNVKIIDSKSALMSVYEEKISSARKIFNESKVEKKTITKENTNSIEPVNIKSKEDF